MKLYFKTREKARQFKSGKMVDHGAEAIQGKRFARDISFKQKKEKIEHAMAKELSYVLEYV